MTHIHCVFPPITSVMMNEFLCLSLISNGSWKKQSHRKDPTDFLMSVITEAFLTLSLTFYKVDAFYLYPGLDRCWNRFATGHSQNGVRYRIPLPVWLVRRQTKNILKTNFKNMLSNVSVLTDFCTEKDGGKTLSHKIR